MKNLKYKNEHYLSMNILTRNEKYTVQKRTLFMDEVLK